MEPSFEDVSPTDAHRELAEGKYAVLDVRTAPEYRSHRLPNAVLIPVQELASRAAELDPDQPWLVVCEHGMRSVAACEFLAKNHGFEWLFNLAGGMAHWVHAELPVEQG